MQVWKLSSAIAWEGPKVQSPFRHELRSSFRGFPGHRFVAEVQRITFKRRSMVVFRTPQRRWRQSSERQAQRHDLLCETWWACPTSPTQDAQHCSVSRCFYWSYNWRFGQSFALVQLYIQALRRKITGMFSWLLANRQMRAAAYLKTKSMNFSGKATTQSRRAPFLAVTCGGLVGIRLLWCAHTYTR